MRGDGWRPRAWLRVAVLVRQGAVLGSARRNATQVDCRRVPASVQAAGKSRGRAFGLRGSGGRGLVHGAEAPRRFDRVASAAALPRGPDRVRARLPSRVRVSAGRGHRGRRRGTWAEEHEGEAREAAGEQPLGIEHVAGPAHVPSSLLLPVSNRLVACAEWDRLDSPRRHAPMQPVGTGRRRDRVTGTAGLLLNGRALYPPHLPPTPFRGVDHAPKP